MLAKNNNLFYLMLFLAMFGWGASWVNVKVLSQYIDEFEMVFFRFGLTSITMIPIMIYLKKSFRIDIKTLGLVLLTSISFIAYMKYFFLGTKLGTASLGGALVTSLAPINTFVMLAFMGEKKIGKNEMTALILGALGVLTMLNVWLLDMSEIFVVQNLYFILASVLWPIVTILSSRSTKISPIVFTFYLYIVTVILDMIFFVDLNSIHLSEYDSKFWLNIASIVLLASTFANTIYFVGVEKLGTSSVSSFIFIVPFAAIGLSVIFLGEHISISIIIGAFMTLWAVKKLNNIKIFQR